MSFLQARYLFECLIRIAGILGIRPVGFQDHLARSLQDSSSLIESAKLQQCHAEIQPRVRQRRMVVWMLLRLSGQSFPEHPFSIRIDMLFLAQHADRVHQKQHVGMLRAIRLHEPGHRLGVCRLRRIEFPG